MAKEADSSKEASGGDDHVRNEGRSTRETFVSTEFPQPAGVFFPSDGQDFEVGRTCIVPECGICSGTQVGVVYGVAVQSN